MHDLHVADRLRCDYRATCAHEKMKIRYFRIENVQNGTKRQQPLCVYCNLVATRNSPMKSSSSHTIVDWLDERLQLTELSSYGRAKDCGGVESGSIVCESIVVQCVQ